MDPDRAKAAREILAFYLDAGVDALIGDAPVDRLANALPQARSIVTAAEVGDDALWPRHDWEPSSREETSPPAGPSAGTLRLASRRAPAGSEGDLDRHGVEITDTASQKLAPVSPDAAAMAAREAARTAESLEGLRVILERFDGCALKATASQLVFHDGNPRARVMFVGEAPGREEDLAGVPFVGRSGRLLDRMMASIGLDRTTAYIANIVPWRPPGNRTPTPQEVAICLPFIRRQIELCDPDILVCLGKPAAQALIGSSDGIRKLRGRFVAYDTGSREIRALATFHPAYLLRQPLEKRLAWRDFLAIKRALGAG
jgi:uracil-DNA glycosylase family 4